MSRFFMTVLVPAETPRDKIGLAVEELMAPYQGLDPCYRHFPDARCRCALVRAQYIAAWAIDRVYPNTTSGSRDRPIRSIFLEYDIIEEQLRHGLARSDCQFCHGTGLYSPDFERPIRFDGAAYGGAYHTGWIRGEPRAVEPDEPRPTLEDNLTTVRELLELYSPHEPDNRFWFTNSLLTPDADWYSAPWDMGCRRADKDAFESEFLRRLRDNLDCWAVGLECLV